MNNKLGLWSSVKPALAFPCVVEAYSNESEKTWLVSSNLLYFYNIFKINFCNIWSIFELISLCYKQFTVVAKCKVLLLEKISFFILVCLYYRSIETWHQQLFKIIVGLCTWTPFTSEPFKLNGNQTENDWYFEPKISFYFLQKPTIKCIVFFAFVTKVRKNHK